MEFLEDRKLSGIHGGFKGWFYQYYQWGTDGGPMEIHNPTD